MLPTQQGSIRLFRFAGIEVFLHWTWFLVALIGVKTRSQAYSSFAWNVLEYLALFAIVLMHEFGHSLACRQVGGRADRIVLWPLGGVAYVAPPPRPGATLWSIAAGPLVNLVLAPVLVGLLLMTHTAGLAKTVPNAYFFLQTVCIINLVLLLFNLLPIYPLDGGQILRSLLWYLVGRARSLMITVSIGFVGVAGLVLVAVLWQDIWIGIISAFILLNCWRGLQEARILARVAKLPRRDGFVCPTCHQPPVLGPFWRCARCFRPYDIFETHALCPYCGTEGFAAQCLDCGNSHPLAEWSGSQPVPPRL